MSAMKDLLDEVKQLRKEVRAANFTPMMSLGIQGSTPGLTNNTNTYQNLIGLTIPQIPANCIYMPILISNVGGGSLVEVRLRFEGTNEGTVNSDEFSLNGAQSLTPREFRWRHGCRWNNLSNPAQLFIQGKTTGTSMTVAMACGFWGHDLAGASWFGTG